MSDDTIGAEQQLAEKERELVSLKRQQAEQERLLNQIQADYSQLRLAHAALSDKASTLRQELDQATQERDYLHQNLARFEEDLRALQNTRTVKATSLAGQTLKSRKSKVESRRSEDSSQRSAVSGQRSASNSYPSSLILHPSPYYTWIAENEPSDEELVGQSQKAKGLAYRPLISIIMPVYNPAPEVLKAAIASAQAQTYDEWELCIADASTGSEVRKLLEEAGRLDERIEVRLLAQNEGITGNSNAALEVAQGEFCAFLDHDDTLAPDALFEVAQVLNKDNRLDFLYSDFDLLTENGTQRLDPLFKPDWSPEIMLSANYLTHLTVIRTALIREVDCFSSGTEGAQDWDLFLRVVEKTERIHHLPKVLYHWRQSRGSTAGNIYNKPEVPQTQLRVIEAHLKRQGIDGKAFFDKSGFIRVSWPMVGAPKVSIIIPTKDKLELLRPCLQSILEKTQYPDYEVLVVDTGSTQPEVASYYQELASEPRLKILYYDQPFNYSAVNNWAAKQCQGEMLLFLNNDTEVIEPDWLEEMVRWGQRPEVGLVGAKLLKPDGVIQHAGVIVGLGGYAGHIFAGLPESSNTIFGYTEWYRDFSAVTAACMLVRRGVFEELDGFEEAFKLNGSDVDLGLRARAKGYRVVFNPFARLYHLESATHQGRVPFSDYRLSQERYRPLLENGDPYFNPNLSYNKATPSFKKK